MTPLLLLASCTTDFDQQLGGSRTGAPDGKAVFVASTEGPSALTTKVYADENLKVLWNAGDRISIFNRTTGNTEYAFTGDDGDTAGDFEVVSEVAGDTDIDNVYAKYPYQDATTVSAAGVLTTVLPAEQYYKEKSFGIGANTMVAVTDGNFLAFKNVGGYLSFRLYGDNISVSRITIKGNHGEKIAGKAAITIPVGGTPSVVMDGTATDAISVVCNPPVKIGTSTTDYTDFWFVIPPTTFTGGFTITVTDHMGGVYEKSTTSSFTISRNKLDWMNPIKVVPDYVKRYVDLGLPSGTMWATMNIGASTLYEDGDFFAWGETEKKTSYFWGTYQYYDYDSGIISPSAGITKYTGFDYSILQEGDDAARVNWGGDWRMPTAEEWAELKENCTYELIRQDSKYVWKITGKNGCILFLPGGGRYFESDILDFNSQGNGYYWSSSLVENDILSAKVMNPTWSDLRQSDLMRYMGALVRPVLGGPVTDGPNTINGHKYVDMGDGLKWATMNIGASRPWQTGNLFAWGEITPKTSFSWGNYSLASIPASESNPDENGWWYINKYTVDDGTFNIDDPASLWSTAWYHVEVISYGDDVEFSVEYIGDYCTSLSEADDAAYQNWGSAWHIPSEYDYCNLLDISTYEFQENYKGSGQNGYLFTSKINGNQLFFPISGGYYWTSNLSFDYETRSAEVFSLNPQNSYPVYFGTLYRYVGLPIRPVSY